MTSGSFGGKGQTYVVEDFGESEGETREGERVAGVMEKSMRGSTGPNMDQT